MRKEDMTQKGLHNKSLRNSIQAKITLIIILTATVIFAGFAFYEYFVTSAVMKENFDHLAEYIVNQQSKSLELPLWYLDTDAIEDVIYSAMTEKQVYAILVREESGIVYGKMRDNNWNIVKISKEFSSDYYTKSKEIVKNNEKFGVVEVYLTPEFMQEKLNDATADMFITLIIFNISLGSVLLFSIRKSVIVPVNRVAEGVRLIASGDFDRSIHSKRKDEIGQLASDVESMRLAIKKSFDLVQEKHEALQIEISERERIEEALRASEEKYRAIFDQAGDSIVLVDAETGALVEFNEMAHKTLGYTSDEFKELKISDINVDGSHEEIQENIKRRTQERVFKFDSRHKTKDGKIRNVQITGKSINIQGENVNLAIWNDITERKEAEDQVKASLSEKEVLLKEVHHRVKNNLQIISSLLDMSRRRAGNQEAMDLIAESEAKIQTMALIHTQLYQSDRFDQINMQNHIRDLIIYLSQLYGAKKNITPIINTSDVILSVTQAIPFALAINELIANVFKHAFEEGKGGILEVSMEHSSDGAISVKVKDDGIGIPEEVDIDNTDTLGMKLVRNLILKQLKGKLRIERNNGTEVFMEFKVSEEEAKHA